MITTTLVGVVLAQSFEAGRPLDLDQYLNVFLTIQARPLLLDRMKSVDFRFSEAKWRELATTVEELSAKGIRLLLIVPPFHPISAEAAAADPDGTSHEGQKELVRRLQEYAPSKHHVWFRDFNNGGHHDFGHADFYDEDHLNRQGSYKLTDLIMEWMNQCQSVP